MPQMNPIWWFSLFLIFVITLMISNSMNYFYSSYKISKNTNTTLKHKKNINWKW